jgi:hypothetical protein
VEALAAPDRSVMQINHVSYSMIKLIVNEDKVVVNGTSFGGRPVHEEGHNFDWPICKSCNLPMQFLGKIETDLGLEQIFMCQNNPGCCDEWEANSGGNSVLISNVKNPVFVVSPSEGEVIRACEHGAKVVEIEAENYDDARVQWTEQTGNGMRQVLGQLFGEPLWLQNDETPECSVCGKAMRFVAQLEQGPDGKTEMNFGGGGCAYLFDCRCKNTAKFLWQC